MRTRLRALALATFAILLLLVDGSNAADTGETLYNGIVLPREWPPRLADFPTSVEQDPVIPPYLASPPAVIPIDVGRQPRLRRRRRARIFEQPGYGRFAQSQLNTATT